MYLNKAQLHGNLTRDPELRTLPSGQAVINFSLATNRSYKDKDGAKKEQVEYHNVVGFGKQAEIIGQYVKKGDAIFVEGRLQTRSWETDGRKNYRTEIVIESFQFGGVQRKESTPKKETEQKDEPVPPEYPTEDDINTDDIPF